MVDWHTLKKSLAKKALYVVLQNIKCLLFDFSCAKNINYWITFKLPASVQIETQYPSKLVTNKQTLHVNVITSKPNSKNFQNGEALFEIS